MAMKSYTVTSRELQYILTALRFPNEQVLPPNVRQSMLKLYRKIRPIPNSEAEKPRQSYAPRGPNNNKRQVPRVTLLRGLVEEIAYEESLAKLYAGLLASVIVENNPRLKAEYQKILELLD